MKKSLHATLSLQQTEELFYPNGNDESCINFNRIAQDSGDFYPDPLEQLIAREDAEESEKIYQQLVSSLTNSQERRGMEPSQ